MQCFHKSSVYVAADSVLDKQLAQDLVIIIPCTAGCHVHSYLRLMPHCSMEDGQVMSLYHIDQTLGLHADT